MSEKKVKRLCKWKKEQIDKDFDKLVDVIGTPRFACRRCGRAAADKKWLCKPAKLGDD